MSATTQPRSIVNRTPIYYGWVIYIFATLGITASMPGQTANISLFIDRWIAEFGLDNRSTISALYGVGTFVASLGLTVVGNRVDRHGTRRMSVVICVLFALALVYMAFVSNLAMLLIGFVFLRLLGQGAMILLGQATIANWFQRMRGRVQAFALIGFSVFQAWYVPFMTGTLNTIDWRQVWWVLAAVMAFGVLPLLALFIREKPEDYGVLPDGAPPDVVDATSDPASTLRPRFIEANFTLREAMTRPIFWVFIIGGLMGPAFMTGIVFHQESLFSSFGYDTGTASVWVGRGFLLASFSTIVTGFLIDQVRAGYVRAIELAMLAGLMLMSTAWGLGAASGAWVLPTWTLLFGTVMGMGGVFNGSVWANLFGRGHQGEILGFVAMTSVTGTAIGPFVLALSFDAFGSYDVALFIGAVVALLPLAAGLFMTTPRPRD